MQKFDEIINGIPQALKAFKDEYIFSSRSEIEEVNRRKLIAPELHLNQKTVSVGKEKIDHHNAPVGISYIPGKEMEYAIYRVPVTGDLSIYKSKYSFETNKKSRLYFEASYVVYREYSSGGITGNSTIIEQIKENAKIRLEEIQKQFEEIAMLIDDFNEKKMPEEVKKALEIERQKRNINKNTLTDLDF